jgi:hypothetical protein
MHNSAKINYSKNNFKSFIGYVLVSYGNGFYLLHNRGRENLNESPQSSIKYGGDSEPTTYIKR